MQDRHLHCNAEVVDSDVMGADDNLATVQVKRGSGLPGLGTQDSHSFFLFFRRERGVEKCKVLSLVFVSCLSLQIGN